MGEEYKEARTKLPVGILLGHSINGLLALATLLSLMAATPRLETILDAPFGQAHLYLCLSIPSNIISPTARADSVGITSSIMLLTAGSFGLATASRCIFAGARVGLFPGFASRILSLLFRSKPWPAMILSALASLLWALFTFSGYAFNIISSLSTLGLWFTFILTMVAVLTFKFSGEKCLPDGDMPLPTTRLSATAVLHLRLYVCMLALLCAVPLFFILCLPGTLDPSTIDAQSFPWAPVVFLVVTAAAALNYFFGFHSYRPEWVSRRGFML